MPLVPFPNATVLAYVEGIPVYSLGAVYKVGDTIPTNYTVGDFKPLTFGSNGNYKFHLEAILKNGTVSPIIYEFTGTQLQ